MSEDARTEVDELLADEEEQARTDAGSDTSHDLAEEASPVVEKPKGSPGLVTPGDAHEALQHPRGVLRARGPD